MSAPGQPDGLTERARAEAERRWQGAWTHRAMREEFVAGAAWAAQQLAERLSVEVLCEVMHDAYEAAAATAGWETQERSRKPWADVPEANKATMRVAVRALLAALGLEVRDDR